MAKRIKEDESLVKVFWQDVRRHVINVNPEFAELVDNLNLPANEFPLYIARYPYGSSLGGGKGAILPNEKGKLHRLLDIHFSEEIMNDLGYGKDGLPLGMLLDKQMEYFFDLKNQNLTIPTKIYTPGMFFALNDVLSKRSQHKAVSNVLVSATAGARSVLMLPNISSSTNHLRLKHELKLHHPVPKSLYEHGLLFKEIAENYKNTWRLELLYFSKSWIDKINTDPLWMSLRLYLERLHHNAFAYGKDHFFYTIFFSLLQKEANLKVGPNLTDTIRWLFTLATGQVPGYAPGVSNDALPLSDLQYIYSKIYRLEQRLPIIMIPQKFDMKHGESVYYPLKYPSMPQFSMKMRESSTALEEMRQLWDLLRFFVGEISQKESICAKTILAEVAKTVEFSFFHCDKDSKKIISSSIRMLEDDSRFTEVHHSAKVKYPTFPRDSAFLRGCIRLRKKS